MSTETPQTWRTRAAELEPDHDPLDRCGAVACKRRVCNGRCAQNQALRALSARLERERLERLALKGAAA